MTPMAGSASGAARQDVGVLRALVNPHADPAAVAPPAGDARPFHQALPGYAPTPLHERPDLAAATGLARLAVKDETARLGLPAFKVLGASWAVERALRERPDVHTLVAASAGNHGRAVARVAAERGLACRVFLPARSRPRRREAIAGEGAEVVVVDGTYEDAVAQAAQAGGEPGCLELADVGDAGPARWVVDGYATLFGELDADLDLLVVPVGVGSLAAAAARFGARAGVRVVGVEPATAACLTASLAAGAPTAVPTPGTSMAGLDCAEVSPAAWPDLRAGIAGTVTVTDDEADAAAAELAAGGVPAGESGAAALAGLRVLAADPAAAGLRAALGLGPATRAVVLVTEGRTG
jgi:diaminopropionate ammonia-lyase